jgi:NAD(P)-dependent dehydrogenase (short-subunit alcohol dehydrogenase family)
MRIDLSGKTAIVIGSTAGIGFAVAKVSPRLARPSS